MESLKLTEPHYMFCGTLRFRGTPVEEHWSRRATQNMSATRNSPTIGLDLRALLLSAVTVSLHYLPRRLH